MRVWARFKQRREAPVNKRSKFKAASGACTVCPESQYVEKLIGNWPVHPKITANSPATPDLVGNIREYVRFCKCYSKVPRQRARWTGPRFSPLHLLPLLWWQTISGKLDLFHLWVHCGLGEPQKILNPDVYIESCILVPIWVILSLLQGWFLGPLAFAP